MRILAALALTVLLYWFADPAAIVAFAIVCVAAVVAGAWPSLMRWGRARDAARAARSVEPAA